MSNFQVVSKYLLTHKVSLDLMISEVKDILILQIWYPRLLLLSQASVMMGRAGYPMAPCNG